MGAVTASIVINAENLIEVRAHRSTLGSRPVIGSVDVGGLAIQSSDPEALDDLAHALSEAASRMRIIERTEAVA